MSQACFDADTIEQFNCPENGTNLTYDNFGSQFVGQYCQACHAEGAGERKGAPIDITFNSLEDIRTTADRIFARSARDNTSMPPGPDDPTKEERYMLGEWLACGAP